MDKVLQHLLQYLYAKKYCNSIWIAYFLQYSISTGSVFVSKFEGPSLKKASVQTLAKMTAIWNKHNRSTLSAEKIKDAFGDTLELYFWCCVKLLATVSIAYE